MARRLVWMVALAAALGCYSARLPKGFSPGGGVASSFKGPPVASGAEGTARFAEALHIVFDGIRRGSLPVLELAELNPAERLDALEAALIAVGCGAKGIPLERTHELITVTIVGQQLVDARVVVSVDSSDVSSCVAAVRAMASLCLSLRSGRIPAPRRTLVFMLGPAQGAPTLPHDGGATSAAHFILGAAPQAASGKAVSILWRNDVTVATAGSARGDALALIARCAFVDKAALDGGWKPAEESWSPGAEPARDGVILSAGKELDKDTSARGLATFAAALAAADAHPLDLARYLESLDLERRLRLAALEEGQDEQAEAWMARFDAARHWLRALCLDLQP
jgi:hypothetical protein